MAEVTVQFQVRTLGRTTGETMTVERTDYIDTLIKTGRLTVIGEAPAEPAPEPDEVVVENVNDADLAEPAPRKPPRKPTADRSE